ncbi:MAG: response regulator [Candidatus Eisenbacteria bacterium]|uniref:Response regulator n=1 Tax=Eiseniibacteriota bacterium TaxID=2212470 RepID=A0A933SG64_UNCEI|nr:response regulator [Candidatus Eisenbacteria bacterium]
MNPVGEALWPPIDRVMIADDERTVRMTLTHGLEKAGFDVTSVEDGHAALAMMTSDSPPQVLLLDWSMPGLTGPELCRWVRSQPVLASCYVILVTARDTTEDMLEGMEAGADDFIRKPFQIAEVVARARAGRRLASMQAALNARLVELEAALAEVRNLRGLIPICAHCHSIRSSGEHWQKLEAYIEQHSEATFSHSICDACMDKYYPEEPEDGLEEKSA